MVTKTVWSKGQSRVSFDSSLESVRCFLYRSKTHVLETKKKLYSTAASGEWYQSVGVSTMATSINREQLETII